MTFHCSTLSRFADSVSMSVCLSQHRFSSVMVPLWLTGLVFFSLGLLASCFSKPFAVSGNIFYFYSFFKAKKNIQVSLAISAIILL